jgi:hypothetical protein
LKLLVDSQPNTGLDSNTHQIVDKGHNTLISDEVESSMKICASLWNVHGIGLYDQHILFENLYKQSGKIFKVLTEPDQLDEQLEDILDMIDLETAIRFLREDVRKCSEACDNQGQFELLESVINAPIVTLFDLKKEFITEGTGLSAPSVLLSTLRVDYNIVSNTFSTSFKAQQKTSPLIISLISYLDDHKQAIPFFGAAGFVIQCKTSEPVPESLYAAMESNETLLQEDHAQ